MFKTDRSAELPPEELSAQNDVQFWSYVEQDVIWPWFYLQIAERDDDATFRSMLMVPSPTLLENILAAQSDYVRVEQVQVVTPHHVNKKGRWQMELLLEIRSIGDVWERELGYEYKVEGGATYSVLAREPANHQRRTRLVFSSKQHLQLFGVT